MKYLMKDLKEKRLVSSHEYKLLAHNFSGVSKQPFENQLFNARFRDKHLNHYNEGVKQFEVTLQHYSQKHMTLFASIRTWAASVVCDLGFFCDVVKLIGDIAQVRPCMSDVVLVIVWFQSSSFIREFCLLAVKDEKGNFLRGNRGKTVILDFVFSIVSMKSITQELQTCSYLPFRFILMHKFCQDHLELLFKNICRCALRRILIRNSIEPSITQNCIHFDDAFFEPNGLYDLTIKRNQTKQ